LERRGEVAYHLNAWQVSIMCSMCQS
jgi:hypothetical protein